MNLLMISLDKGIFKEGSASLERLKEYSELTDKIFVIVWTTRKEMPIEYGNKLFIYPTNSENKTYYFFNTFKIFKKIKEKNRIDLISTQDPFETGFAGWLIKILYKIPLQLQVHGDYTNGYFAKESCLNTFRFFIANFLLPKADCIRTVSKRISNHLISKLNIPAEQVTEVPIYASTFAKTWVDKDLRHKANDAFIFLTIGRLENVKNIAMQIYAISDLIQSGKKAKLIIVGDGGERESLEQLSKKLRITNYVEFKGWQSDLCDYYSSADAFLFTSNYEGWGMAAIEAAGYGLPIIMTDVGCAGEALINNESALIIPIGNKKELEEKMAELMKSEDLRRKLGENAMEAVKKLPNKKRTLELYKESWDKAIK